MGSGRESELKEMARRDLVRLGYETWPAGVPFGKSVIRMFVGSSETIALLQTRSYDDTGRYLVGIVVPDLKQVAEVILWFEDEPSILRIPAKFLREILAEREQRGDARFTQDRQWRVDIYFYDRELSPQGSAGDRYSLDKFYVQKV